MLRSTPTAALKYSDAVAVTESLMSFHQAGAELLAGAPPDSPIFPLTSIAVPKICGRDDSQVCD